MNLSSEDLELEELLDRRKEDLTACLEVVRPVVQADGGELTLVKADYVTGVVYVQLSGACGSCSVSEVTLRVGLERILKQRLPWVTELVGDVEESSTQGYGRWQPVVS